MKHISIAIFLLLSFLFSIPFSINAQEDETGLTYEESIQINQDVEDNQTLEATLIDTQNSDSYSSISFLQIAFAVLAPITLITIGYLLIKKLKL